MAQAQPGSLSPEYFVGLHNLRDNAGATKQVEGPAQGPACMWYWVCSAFVYSLASAQQALGSHPTTCAAEDSCGARRQRQARQLLRAGHEGAESTQ